MLPEAHGSEGQAWTSVHSPAPGACAGACAGAGTCAHICDYGMHNGGPFQAEERRRQLLLLYGLTGRRQRG